MNNVYIRRPSAITAEQFDPHRAESTPKELIFWDEALNPQDGSWGYINTQAGMFKVFAGDWICRANGTVWVVEKKVFTDLYMHSLA